VLTLVVAIALAAAGARTPQDAVHRFIQPRSPKDACAQLSPAYRKATEARYGPCLAGMSIQPKATRLVISQVHVTGTHATLVAAYSANARRFRERYTLARVKGVWLITGAKQL